MASQAFDESNQQGHHRKASPLGNGDQVMPSVRLEANDNDASGNLNQAFNNLNDNSVSYFGCRKTIFLVGIAIIIYWYKAWGGA